MMTQLLENVRLTFAALTSFWIWKASAAFLFATYAFLFGPITEAHTALFVVWMLDLITGVIASAKEHRLSSNVGWSKGFGKLFAYLTLLILVFQLEKATAGTPIYARLGDFGLVTTIIYLLLSESLSVVENVSRITGVPLSLFNNPTKLLLKFEAQQDKKEA